MFNKLFDLLNSRNIYGTELKTSFSLSNYQDWNNTLNESDCETYIRNLICENKSILKPERKVFAFGFLIDITSIRGSFL